MKCIISSVCSAALQHVKVKSQYFITFVLNASHLSYQLSDYLSMFAHLAYCLTKLERLKMQFFCQKHKY